MIWRAAAGGLGHRRCRGGLSPHSSPAGDHMRPHKRRIWGAGRHPCQRACARTSLHTCREGQNNTPILLSDWSHCAAHVTDKWDRGYEILCLLSQSIVERTTPDCKKLALRFYLFKCQTVAASWARARRPIAQINTLEYLYGFVRNMYFYVPLGDARFLIGHPRLELVGNSLAFKR